MARVRRICTLDGCDRPRHGADYCRPHYRKHQEHGDPYHGGEAVVRIAKPITWEAAAACKGVDPDLFFPAKGTSTLNAPKRVCAECTVRAECLQEALTSHEEFGVWGGLGRRERMLYVRRYGETVTVLPPIQFGGGNVVDLATVREGRAA